MLKKTIKYVDYNGVEREEDFNFNLNKAELTEMELSHKGGLTALIERVIKEKESTEIIKIFKDLVCKSYGVKSDDGKKFVKSDEVLNDFTQSEAYSELFMELATDAKAAADFIDGIIPKMPVDKHALHPGAKK